MASEFCVNFESLDVCTLQLPNIKCPFLNQCLIYKNTHIYVKKKKGSLFVTFKKTFSTSHRKIKEQMFP